MGLIAVVYFLQGPTSSLFLLGFFGSFSISVGPSVGEKVGLEVGETVRCTVGLEVGDNTLSKSSITRWDSFNLLNIGF